MHHRRAKRSGRRVALTVAAGMLAGAFAAAAFQQGWWTGDRASATPLAAQEQQQPSAHAADAGRPAVLSNLGEVRGLYRIPGPASAPRGAWVVFAVDGPQRMTHNDVTAPFTFQLDTRTLPDGRYMVNVLLVRPGSSALVWSRGIQIVNHPTTRARPGMPALPPAHPAPTTPAARPPSSAPPAPAPPPAGGTTAPSGFTAEVLRLTNQQRTANGCRALTANATLTSVAQAHSADMAAHNYFSHDSQNGQSPFDRMTAAGYRFSAAAENIAAGQPTPASVVDAWMHSTGHRANILNCGYTEIGIGYATGGSYGSYWTQDFGTPA